MKKSTKTIAGVLIGLAAASVIGVGFSAWVINQTNTAVVTDITVDVAETQDKSIMIYGAAVSDGNIRFDAKTDDTTGPIVYGAESGGGEDLSFSVTYRVEIAPNVTTGTVTAALAFNASTTKETAYTTAETANHFIAPLTIDAAGSTILNATSSTLTNNAISKTVNTSSETVVTSVVSNYTGEKTNSTYTAFTVTTTFTYYWGSRFNYLNPAEYATNENLSTVVSDLATLQNASGAALKVTLATQNA